MNFALFLEMHARSAPSETALVDGKIRMSWSELDVAANQFANMLADAGIGEGERVATHLPNCAEAVIAFLGTLKAGAVFVPLNARLQGPDLARILNHCRPRCLITGRKRLPILGGWSEGILILVDGQEGEPSFLQRLAAQSAAFAMVGLQADRMANLIYTSGTTGMPKAAIHTHGVRVAVAAGMTDSFKLSRRDVGLVLSPLFHISGLHVLCNALFVGGKIVLMPKWDIRRFMDMLRAERVTFMQLVTTLLVDIANAPAELFTEPTAVRFAWGGGHNVDPQIIATFERRIGGLFLQGWGRTEGGSTYNQLDPHLRRFDAHGIPNANSSEVAVYHHAERRLARANEVGEIVVRGDGVSPGYWDGGEIRSPEAVEGGWLPVADTGWFDDAGQMHFLGRADHMIKTGGENVYPAEVEAILLALPQLADAVVLGVPDVRLGQCVAALVVPRTRISRDEIDAACRRSLAGFKIPRRIAIVEKLPRLANEKVDLVAAREIIDRMA